MSNSIKSTLLHVVFFVLAVSVVTVRSTCAEGYDFVACEVGGSYVAASPKTQNCIIGMKKCCDKDMAKRNTPTADVCLPARAVGKWRSEQLRSRHPKPPTRAIGKRDGGA
ncbi:hypothetical protein H4Q26_004002 [Puccinia striiformis f. sp. tritici PST-130]|nr:hypothetical protein H4Q26_004002 [Puccinia striiformis f. sp. tritici PST-130]